MTKKCAIQSKSLTSKDKITLCSKKGNIKRKSVKSELYPKPEKGRAIEKVWIFSGRKCMTYIIQNFEINLNWGRGWSTQKVTSDLPKG